MGLCVVDVGYNILIFSQVASVSLVQQGDLNTMLINDYLFEGALWEFAWSVRSDIAKVFIVVVLAFYFLEGFAASWKGD
jgi:hypothetical protein